MSSPTERALSVSLLYAENGQPRLDVSADLDPQQWSDAHLLDSLKTGQPDALAEAFRRYSRLVMSIGLRILHDEGEAEEIVHDVFLFLYERASEFEQNKGDAKGWVVQLAYHRSLEPVINFTRVT
jgi:RNA polymerase sigma-70 factor (ECF subfamily)